MHCISLIGLTSNKLYRNTFEYTQPTIINTDNSYICCISPSSSHCTQSAPWFEPCSDILPQYEMKLTYVVVVCFLMTSNLVSVFLHSFSSMHGAAFAVCVVFVHGADIVVTFYLLTAVTVDSVMGENYVVSANQWKSGLACLAISSTLVLYAFSNPVSVQYLSFSRLMVVVSPIDSNFKRKKYVLKSCTVVHTCSLLCTITMSVCVGVFAPELETSICLPFYSPQHHTVFEVLVWLVSLIQIIFGVCVTCQHLLLPYKMKQSQAKLLNFHKKQNTKSLNAQLTLLTLTAFLCWFPCDIIYMVCMFLERYPLALVYWVAVGVMPVNAAGYPVVLGTMCIKRMWQARSL